LKTKKTNTAVSSKAGTDDLIKNKFPIVGIGASAGGLEALDLFLKNVPDKSGMAYI